MTRRTTLRSALACAATSLLSATAHAQLFRAYLESTGSDANPCTLPAPCRLLPAALAAVASGGEIWMLDSANYNTGPVNVTKSVTLLAVPGALGSVVAAGGSALNIGTPGVKVTLRNLMMVPLPGGGGTSAITMTSGNALTIEDCLIANLPSKAVFVLAAAIVRITDTTIRDNGSEGLWLENGARGTIARSTISGNASSGVAVFASLGGSTTTADIADSTLDANLNGLSAYSQNATAVVKVTVHDSRIGRNSQYGMSAASDAGAAVTLSASDNMFSNNAAALGAFNAGSKVWASGNTVSDNAYGFMNSSGVFESAGNNALRNQTALDTTGTIIVVATD